MSEQIKPFPFRPEDKAICPFHADGTVKIGKAVHAVQTNGWPEAEDLDPRVGASYENTKEIQAAVYIASAPITLDIITRALENAATYPPFGLVNRGRYDTNLQSYPITSQDTLSGPRPFQSLQTGLKTALALASEANQLEYLHHEMDTLQSTIYEAHAKLGHWRTGSNNELANRGVSTGVGSSTNLLEAIEPVARRDLSESDLSVEVYTEIAKNSYHLLAPLALDDISVCVQVLYELQDRRGPAIGQAPFNPDYLFINSQHSLEISPDFIKGFKKKHGVWLGERNSIGCPVVHTKALLLLWNWEIEIAKSLWSETT